MTKLEDIISETVITKEDRTLMDGFRVEWSDIYNAKDLMEYENCSGGVYNPYR